MTTQRSLVQALHDVRCTGVGTHCNGGDHLAVFRPLARDILRAEDPASVLHDHFCDAQLDSSIRRCPAVDRHVQVMRDWLQKQGVPA